MVHESTTTYVYDSANQLIRENNQAGGFTHTWTYDDAGNIQTRNEYAYTTGELGTAQDTTTYQYGNSTWGDLLTKIDTYTYYDAVGNPLNNDAYAYTWEHGRQLAELAISSEFAIVTQPEDGECLPTGRAYFNIEAVGTNLTYQWQWLNGSTWTNSQATGAQTSSMSVGAAGENGTTYRCYITDSTGNVAISDSATVHTDPIGFITQPEDCHCSPTGTATFSVEVYGTDVTYQWQWHSPSSTTWQNSGATGANTNSISLGASGDNGTVYRCVITDANGNVAYSEPATVIPYAITWEFEYNADGMRTYRSNGVTSYEYIYNGSQLTRLTITDELDGSQSVMAFAYDAAGKPLSLNYNGTRYIYATNIQGDVIAILNASGTAVVTYTYDAWGTPLSIGGTMADTLGQDNPLRYRGYVWDNETNLYYLQSRYYDPKVGRFINADAFVSTGQGLIGNNMFAYCGNNPVYRSDDTGTFYTSGQIHDFVVKDICKNNPNKTGDDTYISYYEPVFRGRKWYTYGFCDVYDIKTHEVWEVKRLGGGSTCSPTAAAIQLGNYVMHGFLKHHNNWQLKFGGTETSIEPNVFTKMDSDGRGTYVIGYFDAGNGLVFYDYFYIPSPEEALAVACVVFGVCAFLSGTGVAALGAAPALACL